MGSSESHPREPGISVISVGRLVKINQKDDGFVVGVEQKHKTFCKVQDTLHQLGA